MLLSQIWVFFHMSSPAQRMASCPICPSVGIKKSQKSFLALTLPQHSCPYMVCGVLPPNLSISLSTLWTFCILCFHRAFACTVRTESPHLSIYFSKKEVICSSCWSVDCSGLVERSIEGKFWSSSGSLGREPISYDNQDKWFYYKGKHFWSP